MRYTSDNRSDRKPDRNRNNYGQNESGREARSFGKGDGTRFGKGDGTRKFGRRPFGENGESDGRYRQGNNGEKRQMHRTSDGGSTSANRGYGQHRGNGQMRGNYRDRNNENGQNQRFSRPRIDRNQYDTEQQHFSKYKEDDGVRLNRYIANAGVCSRRDAEQYILAGVITINGKVVTELATKVHYGDVVKFNNAPLMPERKTYILLNKPKDYVTTTEDPHAEKTVMDLIGDAGKNRVYPVGRLDRATTGLLLLTNDGDLAEHLCHPKYNKQKIYHVTLDRKVAEEDIEKLVNGIELEDGMANADEIEYCNPENLAEVGVVIHNGRNRIVRRMFEALKYRVKKLDRVYYAGLTKKNLPRGKWRFLTDKEIAMLKRGTYK